MKTFVISATTGVIMMGIGGGLVYDSLSRDLLDCRLNAQRTATRLLLKEEEIKEYHQIIEYYSQK